MKGAPNSVRCVLSILHPYYHVKSRGYDTKVRGISSAVLASRFRAGDTLDVLAADYGITIHECADALRWELIPRRTRVRIVERAVR